MAKRRFIIFWGGFVLFGVVFVYACFDEVIGIGRSNDD
jgi:hypothetical protein